MEHTGFKSYFGLVFATALWFMYSLKFWFFDFDSTTETGAGIWMYLGVSAIILLAVPILIFLAHMLHRFFWRAEDVFTPAPATPAA